MKNQIKIFLFLLFPISILSIVIVNSEALTINNGSFENPDHPGDFTVGLDPAFTQWINFCSISNKNLGHLNCGTLSPPCPDGSNQWAFMRQNLGLTQFLSDTVLDNTDYSFSIDQGGQTNGIPNGGLTIAIYAGDPSTGGIPLDWQTFGPIAPGAVAFRQTTLNSGSGYGGAPLWLLIRNSGMATHNILVDNVQFIGSSPAIGNLHPPLPNSLIVNGNFDIPDVCDATDFSGSVNFVNSPPGFGWNIISDNNLVGIYLVNTLWNGIGGTINLDNNDQSVAFSGNSSISQSFFTTTGQPYELQLFYSHNPSNSSSMGTIIVEGNSILISEDLIHNISNTREDMQWKRFSSIFIADNNTTKLTIQNHSRFTIDNVKVCHNECITEEPPPPPPTGDMPFILDFEDGELPLSHDWHKKLNDQGTHTIVSGDAGAGGTKVLRMEGENSFGWYLNLEGIVDLSTDWAFSADMRRVADGGGFQDQGIFRYGEGNGGSGFSREINSPRGDWNNVVLVMYHANNEVITYVNGKFFESHPPVDELNSFVNSSNAILFGFGNEGTSATAEFDNIIFVTRGIDSDNDGLEDVDELVLGTNISDDDSDDDGLLDGTEVDMAAGGECPNLLNSDSDGDTLLDGDEVADGTNPCAADTDGDGLPDNTDPTPTVPGATPSFLQQEALDLADAIRILDLPAFNGPNDNANEGRRNALANRSMEASAAIASGNIQGAIDSLNSALDKVDGETPPPDWMDDSPEKTALADEFRLLISLLDQEL